MLFPSNRARKHNVKLLALSPLATSPGLDLFQSVPVRKEF
jgi:hypothetical protein